MHWQKQIQTFENLMINLALKWVQSKQVLWFYCSIRLQNLHFSRNGFKSVEMFTMLAVHSIYIIYPNLSYFTPKNCFTIEFLSNISFINNKGFWVSFFRSPKSLNNASSMCKESQGLFTKKAIIRCSLSSCKVHPMSTHQGASILEEVITSWSLHPSSSHGVQIVDSWSA
jgi:hypothetical protein